MSMEIERKYIIKMPDITFLQSQPSYTKSEILQIYLPSKQGETHRIRRRTFADRNEHTETRKIRIDPISSEEIENEISAERFMSLQAKIQEGSRPINKLRHTFAYSEHIIEIDIYPEWTKSAIMEIELQNPNQKVQIPSFIEIICEVTGDKTYSNASMSRRFPIEII